MIRVSATMLESFRRFQSAEWMTYDDLIASITGRSEETREMAIGTAFHEVLAGGTSDLFDADTVRRAQSLVPPTALHEVKQTRKVGTPYGIVTLVAKADAIIGRTVYEHKTTTKIDERKVNGYHDSLQWRVYLDVFGADVCIYDVWALRESDGIIYADDMQVFEMHRYAGLRDDVHRWTCAFVEFCAANGIIQAITREEVAA